MKVQWSVLDFLMVWLCEMLEGLDEYIDDNQGSNYHPARLVNVQGATFFLFLNQKNILVKNYQLILQ